MKDISKAPQKFDLADRTPVFAKDVRNFLMKIPRTIANEQDGKQLVRSSGSVDSNYIEANEAIGKGDFKMKIKISKREARESGFWLQCIHVGNSEILEKERQRLLKESKEFTLILAAILRSVSSK